MKNEKPLHEKLWLDLYFFLQGIMNGNQNN